MAVTLSQCYAATLPACGLNRFPFASAIIRNHCLFSLRFTVVLSQRQMSVTTEAARFWQSKTQSTGLDKNPTRPATHGFAVRHRISGKPQSHLFEEMGEDIRLSEHAMGTWFLHRINAFLQIARTPQDFACIYRASACAITYGKLFLGCTTSRRETPFVALVDRG